MVWFCFVEREIERKGATKEIYRERGRERKKGERKRQDKCEKAN